MEEFFNKPRVFLSHSKKDSKFIEKVRTALQKCQIFAWMDEIEIRHGKPWLDAIFESGIPTCDSILVYLTENSIESSMVKKEIDASLIAKLKDNSMSFLPYVSEENIREKLRVDIQTIQTPVWNLDNYNELLPCVVAEIWHSYLERTIEVSTNTEKRKRLELELELGRIKKEGGDIFSNSEIKDFTYIQKQLDYKDILGVIIKTTQGKDRLLHIEVDLLSLIPFITDIEHAYYSKRTITEGLLDLLKLSEDFKIMKGTGETEIPVDIDIGDELLTFGLIERRENPYFRVGESSTSKFLMALQSPYNYAYTAKMARFKYWLAYNNSYPARINWSIIKNNIV
jgi:hypothetical protein